MFGDLVAANVERSAAALDQQIRDAELESRAHDANRLALLVAAEFKQTPALDGHKSTKALFRATTNQPAAVTLADVRCARLCRDFPDVGDALLAGRVGLGQIDEMVRITRNPRAVQYLDHEQVEMLLGHAEHLS